MVNSFLLASSIFHGSFIVYYISSRHYYNHLSFLYFSGILSSIANHGLTSEPAKWFDRNLMKIVFLINMFVVTNNFARMYFIFILNSWAVGAYYAAKWFEKNENYTDEEKHWTKNLFHFGAHTLCTLSICLIITVEP